MKKLVVLAIAVLFTAGFTSCKKEELAKPSSVAKAKATADLKEHTGWD